MKARQLLIAALAALNQAPRIRVPGHDDSYAVAAMIQRYLEDSKCGICKKSMTDDHPVESLNCGGDCLGCMAKAGDPDAIKALKRKS